MNEQANNDAAAQPRGRHTLTVMENGPRPWKAEKYAEAEMPSASNCGLGAAEEWCVKDADGGIIIDCLDHELANLLAAAPETAAERDKLRELCGELVEALERIVSEAKDPGLPPLAADMVVTALARARGTGVGQ